MERVQEGRKGSKCGVDSAEGLLMEGKGPRGMLMAQEAFPSAVDGKEQH